jgi:formylglycine-generating enzyme required for sulfatase activity
MPRSVLRVLPAILVLAAGCGQNSAGRTDGEEAVESLPVLRPRSGGEMVLVPAGTFTMGDPSGRPEEAPHEVTVSPFYVDRYPVTQELYTKVMDVNPSKRRAPKNPVERTQWTDAVRFCNKCSELEGLTPCYDLTTWRCDFGAAGYRLPTEAEWEYACRAGGTGKYCFGDEEQELPLYAWLKPGSQGKTHPVGEKRPNRWGLFDVHGNVWQWCNDWYAATYYSHSPRQDPRGPAAGKMRVLRGGAWDCPAGKCRAAFRHKEFPVYSDACFGADSYGFRRVRAADAGGRAPVVAAGPKAAPDPRPAKTASRPPPAVRPAPGPGKLAPASLKGTIVFVSDRSGGLQIWSMRAGGKGTRQLTRGPGPSADPRFAPDGKRITYTTLRGGFPEVWLMNRDGSAPRFVTKGSQASWAPDGKALAFIRDNQAYVRNLTSGREERVTPAAWERCGVPAFSPDGRRLAVASRHLGTVGVFVLGLDGKGGYPLKAEEGCCTPQWSRDGTKILCQTVQGHINQVGVDGRDWEQLTFGADVQHDARYSPDGTMIVFCRAPAPEGPWQICVKRLDGDDEEFVQLTSEGSNSLPDWHADE